MNTFTKSQLSIALSVCVTATIAASAAHAAKPSQVGMKPSVQEPVGKFLNKKFEADPLEEVYFTSEEKFVPLDELNTFEYSPQEEKAPKRRASDLTAIAVTPEGEAYVAEVSAEDLKIFDKAMDYIASGNEGIIPGDAKEGELSISSEESSELGGSYNTGDSTTESVLGYDERTRVYGTTYYPYRTVGRIDTGCTGTLIGPRHVLTAGHCVYNTNTDSWYSNLSFSPGQNGTYRPYGKIGWSRVISVRGWTRSHSRNYDYAMIVLNKRIGYTTGWLGYGYKNGGWSMNVNVNGYPVDKSWGTMWHEYCPMNTIWYNSRRVTHTCDTYNGMSGSGLYRYLNGSRTIYAVHTNGSGGGSTNSGTRITQGVFNNLRSWKLQNL